MKILITGRAGSGKSTIAAALKQRGFTAFDTDAVPGLSNWYDRESGQIVQLAGTDFVDLDRYHWMWNPDELCKLIQPYTDVFVCGGAENDFDFEESFDQHLVLDVTPSVQIARLATRTDNDYGRNPDMHPKILERQHRHLNQARDLGATIINTEQPLGSVVDEIIRQSGLTKLASA